jgi:serine/threonine-protein kinase
MAGWLEELASGAEVRGCTVGSVLGRGPHGVVYNAEMRSVPGAPVALKAIRPWTDGQRQRIVRAAGLVASLRADRIAPIVGVGELDDSLLIASRRIEGRDLGSMIARDGRLACGPALRILSDVTSALDTAHERGLIHLDLKPSNVIVTDGAEPRAVVTDFGHSLLPIPDHEALILGDRAYDPTDSEPVHFVAPETIRGEPAGPWTDIYLLGCLAYFAFTGRYPFGAEADTRLPVLFAHVAEAPPAASDVVPDLPSAVDDAIRKAMGKLPDSRFCRARDFTDAIRAGLGDPADERAPGAEVPAAKQLERVELSYSPWRWIGRDEARWLGSSPLEHHVAHLYEVPARGACGRFLLSVEDAGGTDLVVSSPPEWVVPTLPGPPGSIDGHCEFFDLYGVRGQETREGGRLCREVRAFERAAIALVRLELVRESDTRARQASEAAAAPWRLA